MSDAAAIDMPVDDWLAARGDALTVQSGGAAVSGLIRPGTRLARILAVDGPAEDLRGAAIAFAAAAGERGCLVLRAELSPGAPAAGALAAAGFRSVPPVVHASQPDRPVLRLERRLDGGNASRSHPYFAQTTGFTCGPVALMLARRRLAAGAPVDRRTEVALWREATTVHAPAGPGGCDPFGLACAAIRAGLRTRLIASIEGPFLLDRANDEKKRDLMRFVQDDFRQQARELGVAVEIREWSHADLQGALGSGGFALVLIDQVEFHGRNAPHWVLVHGVMAGRNGDATYAVDDPWIDAEDRETDTDRFDVPVPADALDRMGWYGISPYRAAVLVEGPA